MQGCVDGMCVIYEQCGGNPNRIHAEVWLRLHWFESNMVDQLCRKSSANRPRATDITIPGQTMTIDI